MWYISVRRVSNHSQQRMLRGETLDLLRKSSHTEERLKCGVLPINGLCRREAAWRLACSGGKIWE